MNEDFEEYYDKNKKGIAADFITVPLCVQYQLQRAFKAGQVAEREACAVLAESINLVIDEGEDAGTVLMFGGEIANDIRGRG